MDRIKVKFKKSSPYSQYGYYETGETGDVIGFTQNCAIILKGDGSFVKAEPNWIEEVKDHTSHELAESEDEKIRKVLIEHFKGSHSSIFPYKGFTKEQILAWLEKQGEQKPVEKVEPILEGLKTEFQKQVSYLIASVTNKEHEYTLGYVEWVSQSLLGYAQHELKPVEWSEEDESCLITIINELEVSKSESKYETKTYEKLISWLKSLKDRCLPQQKQEKNKCEDCSIKTNNCQKFPCVLRDGEQNPVEWSKEDETNLNWICALLQNNTMRNKEFSKQDKDAEDWLKFLKDRIQPQPKQEFDKEEQETLHFILEDLCDQLDDTSDEGDRKMLNREIAFLRSLEPQSKYRWSAEDNKIRAQITKYFECQIESEPARKDVLLKWIAWVANLRPQPNQEWSEEDKYYRGIIMYCLNNVPVGVADKKNAAAWLKSLRPRSNQFENYGF